MKKFETFTSTVVPLTIDNVDTDQIIPARFLKTTVKTGIGENLFRDWRFELDGKVKPDFVLNKNTYSGRILISGANFGSGSSREHAVWALQDYGFDAVLAKSFADIFKNNSLNNGLLPIEVSDDFWDSIVNQVENNPATQIEINLIEQRVTNKANGMYESFEIDAFRKECILNGHTDLDYLVSIKDEINAFEEKHPVPQVNF